MAVDPAGRARDRAPVRDNRRGLSRIRTTDPGTFEEIGAGAAIIAFRNALAHGYDRIDADRVAAIVAIHVPALVSDVERLLDASG